MSRDDDSSFLCAHLKFSTMDTEQKEGRRPGVMEERPSCYLRIIDGIPGIWFAVRVVSDMVTGMSDEVDARFWASRWRTG